MGVFRVPENTPSNMRLNSGQIEVVDDAMADVYRNMTGAQRLETASRIFSSVRKMILSNLRAVHPDWDEPRLIRETARRVSHGAV